MRVMMVGGPDDGRVLTVPDSITTILIPVVSTAALMQPGEEVEVASIKTIAIPIKTKSIARIDVKYRGLRFYAYWADRREW